ncbi:hypothetical protein PWG15_24510 (plasmid) [Ensifer adhaerens]|uniref:hypothetical protein n=1 Tax=Ensifer adhaerens TaxID=106592 RepID=UPI0023A943D1|nr:hypothetical protein [Ensifer adhaerens]WDZ80918.1 hypothetical protein PWG15_24510 [Ensifer adhaerens]
MRRRSFLQVGMLAAADNSAAHLTNGASFYSDLIDDLGRTAMTNPYPIPRSSRQTDVLVGNGGKVYGPFDGFQIFDTEDVVVWSRGSAAAAFEREAVTVAKVGGLSFDFFTITFAANVPATTEFVVSSERVAERAVGVKKGTMLDMTALEKELSKQATVLQELRRDLDRALKVQFHHPPAAVPGPQDNRVLGWRGGRLANVDPAEFINHAGFATAEQGFKADRALQPGASGTEIGFVRAEAGAVVRTALDKARERKSLLDFIPFDLHACIIAGTNTQDLTSYINSALATGGIIDTLKYTYLTKSRLLPVPGTRLIGHGTFKAIFNSDADKFNDSAAGDGLNMMIRLCSDFRVDSGITFDGSSITTSNFWLYGARNAAAVNDLIFDATIENVSFTGIDISRNGGAWANSDIAVRGRIENCGWSGANLEGVTSLDHSGLSVYRTGWVGIFVGHCFNVVGDGFEANKGVPPYRIYNGPGSIGGGEGGFLFGHFGNHTARWTNFLLYDNRNAAFDGFGIGEDGSLLDAESTNIYAQGQIWYAGLFGFDVSSDMVADIQVWFPTHQGIQIGLDLGGTLANIDIRAQVYNNQNDEAARFSATGPAVRNCSITKGSNSVTVNSGTGFFLEPGQKITGIGMPANAYVGTVVGNTVTMVTTPGGSTPANATAAYGSVSLTFRGIVNFVNIRLDIRAVNCIYGVGIESGADGYATYSNCEVVGDLSTVSVDSVRPLNGDYPSGMAVKASKYKTSAIGKSTPNFSAIGNDTFLLNGGGTLNAITGGYDKQEITVYVNVSDVILNCDWNDVGGNGPNRLVGGGNAEIIVKAGGRFKGSYRQGVGWYIWGVIQVVPWI